MNSTPGGGSVGGSDIQGAVEARALQLPLGFVGIIRGEETQWPLLVSLPAQAFQLGLGVAQLAALVGEVRHQEVHFLAMISIERALGDPVTEPHGKSAANTSSSVTSSSKSASTVDVICHTVRYLSTLKRSLVVTVPSLATLPRSFLIRSTIIRFCAVSF